MASESIRGGWQPTTFRSRKEPRDLEPPSLTFKIFEDKVMAKTVLKPAMQHGEDAITLLTEDHKKVKNCFLILPNSPRAMAAIKQKQKWFGRYAGS